jgi:hypothetical protein
VCFADATVALDRHSLRAKPHCQASAGLDHAHSAHWDNCSRQVEGGVRESEHTAHLPAMTLVMACFGHHTDTRDDKHNCWQLARYDVARCLGALHLDLCVTVPNGVFQRGATASVPASGDEYGLRPGDQRKDGQPDSVKLTRLCNT